MKRKLYLLQIIILSTILTLTGCYTNVIYIDENSGGGIDGSGDYLSFPDLSQLNWQLSAESQVCRVEFNSSAYCQVYMEDEELRKWISFTPGTFESAGTHTVDIFVDENTDGYDRTATVILSCGSHRETVIINQSAFRKDGSPVLPYEPDMYIDIVNRIAIDTYSETGSLVFSSEWRLDFDPGERCFRNMEKYDFTPEGEIISEHIMNHENRIIEHNWIGYRMPEHNLDILKKEYMEITTNSQQFIKHQVVREFNFQNESNPEPVPCETAFFYSDYRRILAQTTGLSYRYDWTEGNMTAQFNRSEERGEYFRIYSFSYSDNPNDRTNIDLNSVLTSDMLSAAGLFGKRSRNLLTRIDDYKGGTSSFEYSFDEQGRVHTITRTDTTNGIEQPESMVYTIFYEGNFTY